MRGLLDSSWMRFGPAGSGSDDWGTGSAPTQEQQSYNWYDLGENRKSELELYVVLTVASILLLALLVSLIYCHCSSSKLSLASIFTLDLQDVDSSSDFLTSLTRNAERHTSTSSDGSDGSDGVFVMVYLSPLYEETLTKVTRNASLTSSKDVELAIIEDLEAKLCPSCD